MMGMIKMTKDNEKIPNMERNGSPFLEKPKTVDPTENNKKDLEKGGGGE